MTAQFAIDFDEGARRRDVGHASALSHVFVDDVRAAIRAVARSAVDFTAETVLETLPESTRTALAAFPNAVGACFRAEALNRRIAPTGEYRPATRPEARKRKLAVWRIRLDSGSGGV